MEIVEQLENEIEELKKNQNELKDKLSEVSKELKRKVKACYLLKGQRLPSYKKRKKIEDAVE